MNSAFVGYEELSGSRKGVIHLGLRPRWIAPSSIRLILHILRKPNSLIANSSIFENQKLKIDNGQLVVLTFCFQFPPPNIQAIKNSNLNKAIHV